jgi:DNA processing protein
MATALPSQREAWAFLAAVHDLGPAGYHALLGAFGGPVEIFAAALRPGAQRRFRLVATAEHHPPLFPDQVVHDIAAIARDADPHRAVLEAADVRVLTLDDPDYPPRLRAIETPPPVLFVRGEVGALDAPHAVAIVGTRRPTEAGRLLAARIGALVAATGAVVVSGLAVGIDGAAHAAAVDVEGSTAAVLGSGHGRLFPRAHLRLARQIEAAGGAILSEFWPEMPPTKITFPRRNRLISGLADATIVVEAGETSGALITARKALEQGRQLFVVPGPVDEPRSVGCLMLLRDVPSEARIVARIPELIADLGILDEVRPRGHRRKTVPSLEAVLLELGPTAGAVGRALVGGHHSLDDLVTVTGYEPATVLSALTLLEIRHLATTTYGRYRAAGQLATASPSGLPGRPGPC